MIFCRICEQDIHHERLRHNDKVCAKCYEQLLPDFRAIVDEGGVPEPPTFPNEKPERYAVGGKLHVCSACGNEEFQTRRVLLNTALKSMLGVDFADDEAATLVCDHCGCITWFLYSRARFGIIRIIR
jgi:predicted nucleic-acid-binding Zn-ribbon protein